MCGFCDPVLTGDIQVEAATVLYRRCAYDRGMGMHPHQPGTPLQSKRANRKQGATVAATVFLAKSADQGFGNDLTKIPFEHVSLVLKYIAIQIPLVTISTGLARSSFILYILKIVGRKRTYQVLLWVILVLQLGANIVSAVLPLSICEDARIVWDPTVKTTCGDQTAVVNFSYFSSCEFFSLLLPSIGLGR